jgi:hypothetical protein
MQRNPRTLPGIVIDLRHFQHGPGGRQVQLDPALQKRGLPRAMETGSRLAGMFLTFAKYDVNTVQFPL